MIEFQISNGNVINSSYCFFEHFQNIIIVYFLKNASHFIVFLFLMVYKWDFAKIIFFL
jgi:hypothetical protein